MRNVMQNRAVITAAVLAAAVGACVASPIKVAAATVGVLSPGQVLSTGQSLRSANSQGTGQFSLVMQTDGNLVLYDPNNQPLWSTSTWGHSVRGAFMQTDGNLVIYSTSGAAIWSSGTWGHPGAFLNVQDDANLVIYTAGDQPLWATSTYSHLDYYKDRWCNAFGCSNWSVTIQGCYSWDSKSVWIAHCPVNIIGGNSLLYTFSSSGIWTVSPTWLGYSFWSQQTPYLTTGANWNLATLGLPPDQCVGRLEFSGPGGPSSALASCDDSGSWQVIGEGALVALEIFR
jgi:hypothetical protein